MFKIVVLYSIFFLGSIVLEIPLFSILSFVLFLVFVSFSFFYLNILLGVIFSLIYISAIAINLFAVVALIGTSVLTMSKNTGLPVLSIFMFIVLGFFYFSEFFIFFYFPYVMNEVHDVYLATYIFFDLDMCIVLLSLYFFIVSLVISSQFNTKIIKSYDYSLLKKNIFKTYHLYNIF